MTSGSTGDDVGRLDEFYGRERWRTPLHKKREAGADTVRRQCGGLTVKSGGVLDFVGLELGIGPVAV